ncbi:hypothetical protein HPB47_015438 [Ixodes persulcatus]|uniref:Uncharacterized protein n=1 Tax=Ixodes persulcatus TaxID=34615 RepID=A0AC60R1Q6_IXOPE|nr:hypothetical protein HPB47_015438 [Ixodes persulcatus]
MWMTLTTSIQKITIKSSREVMMIVFRGPAFIRHVCCGKTLHPHLKIICQTLKVGRCGIKQYVPNEPNAVGLKNFVLASARAGRHSFPDMGLGVARNSVLALVQAVPTCFIIYFDRCFTFVSLVDELLKK